MESNDNLHNQDKIDVMEDIQFEMVNAEKQFKFKKCCPYCGDDVDATVNGWEEDDDGLWMAQDIDANCVSEPDIESEEWEDWMNQHTDMPYVYWLPLTQQIENTINKKYRFVL